MFKKILVGVIALSLLFASAASATVTISGAKHDVWGSKRVTYGYITITGAPTSSGYAVTAKKFGLNTLDKVILYPDNTYPGIDWTYTGSGSNGAASSTGYLVPMAQSLIDKRQVLLAGAGDSIKVTRLRGDGFVSVDAETCIVLVSPVQGCIGKLSAPMIFPSTGALGNTSLVDNIFTATDGLTMGCMSDTGGAYGPIERATNTTHNWYRGDTLYFLPGATDYTARLAYSGRATVGAAVANTGGVQNIYVPFGLGNYIKVTKMTGAQLYAANAMPMYYVPNGALASKFVANQYVAATPVRGGKNADQPIIPVRTPTTVNGFTTVLYFIAIGN